MCNIIEISDLTKTFRNCRNPFGKKNSTTALSEINLELKKGSSLAILGPNGAGKTTLLKIISTLILPDKGTVKVNGLTLGKDDTEIKAMIGLVTTEERSFYWRLTGRQNLEFFSALYGLSPEFSRSRINELFNLFNVDYADKRFDGYSTGMRKKLMLIRAFLHGPEILLLDEPAKSLDYETSEKLKEFIKKESVNGKTVICATHDIKEAECLCENFLIINKGKPLISGGLSQLRGHLKSPSASLAEIYIKLTQNG